MRLMYLLSITAAQKRILIANSYFVPDDKSVDALVAATERGVAIEIIVPGTHHRYGDHPPSVPLPVGPALGGGGVDL